MHKINTIKRSFKKTLLVQKKELEELKKHNELLVQGTFTGVSDSRIKSAENRVVKIELQLSE